MQETRLRIAIAVICLMAVCAVGLSALAKSHQAPAATPVVITEPPAVPVPASSPAVTAINKMYVHIAGAVAKPNVYQVPEDCRLFQLIKMAGGCRPDADLDAVNLAERLTDGEKVYVPTNDEMKSVAPLVAAAPTNDIGRHSSGAASASPSTGAKKTKGSSSRAGHSAKLTDPSQGTVHLNTATAEDLARLPGVGPATAARILAYRQSIGGFKKIDDLQEVSGIGPKKYAKMQPFLKL